MRGVMRGNAEAVAPVAHLVAVHRDIDGEDQGRAPRLARAGHQPIRQRALDDIELEPQFPSEARRTASIVLVAAVDRQKDAARRRPRQDQVPLRSHHAGQAHRRDRERAFPGAAERRDRLSALRDVGQAIRQQPVRAKASRLRERPRSEPAPPSR
jgi:hypothetical protein